MNKIYLLNGIIHFYFIYSTFDTSDIKVTKKL